MHDVDSEMKSLIKIALNLLKKLKTHDERSNHIFYKIVGFSHERKKYIMQCFNTKAIFYAKISDIVFDTDILHSLHPTQACFIGIEYSKVAKNESNPTGALEKLKNSPAYRYGNYELCYQDRYGNLSFLNTKTNEEFIMDPRDIALSQDLIEEFDAIQAFCIGVYAGIKMDNFPKKRKINENKPYLRIVK